MTLASSSIESEYSAIVPDASDYHVNVVVIGVVVIDRNPFEVGAQIALHGLYQPS